jgi:hypothetical protein
MTILLANTWAPGTGALEPSAVPRYLCALVSALLGAGARVRFILRRPDDASALQAAFGNAAWEASVVPTADDVPAIERAVNGASVVLWADSARGRQLVRDGRVLLHLAATMGVQRFVYRSQVQLETSSKTADEAITLYGPSYQTLLFMQLTIPQPRGVPQPPLTRIYCRPSRAPLPPTCSQSRPWRHPHTHPCLCCVRDIAPVAQPPRQG